MYWLRANTAQVIPVGPFLSNVDGLTPVTGLADQSANARLVTNGVGAGFTGASWAGDGTSGHYLVGLTAAQLLNPGNYRLDYSNPTVYGAVWDDFVVLPQAIYDSLIAGIVPIPTITPGAYPVTVTVQNPSNVPLAGAQVSVWSSSGGNPAAFLGWMNTNSLGVATFSLPPGNYLLFPVLNGYTFSASLPFTVVASPVSTTVTATPASPVGTPAPGQCLVYGIVYDASATPISGLELDFYADCPQGVGSDMLTSSLVSVVTGPSAAHPTWPVGYFEQELHQGARVRLFSSLPKLNNLIIRVPSTTTATLASLVELVTPP